MSKSYATKSNARRAAKAAITNTVGDKPEENVDFTIVETEDGKYTWRRIQLQEEKAAPIHPNTNTKAASVATVASIEVTKPSVKKEQAAQTNTCPHCHIDLDNGLLHFNNFQEADEELPEGVHGDTIEEYMCLGCQNTWGKVFIRPGKKKYTKGAVRKVWDICEDNKDLRRKDVINICVAEGINFYTARTQYQAWKQASNNSK